MTKNNNIPTTKSNPSKANRPNKSCKSGNTLTVITKKPSAKSKLNCPDPFYERSPLVVLLF